MSTQQMLNSNPINSSNIIDEYYNPRNLNEDLVEEEMRAKGLDPLNKDDVQKYWKSKGIK
jgi:hypothetical protein